MAPYPHEKGIAQHQTTFHLSSEDLEIFELLRPICNVDYIATMILWFENLAIPSHNVPHFPLIECILDGRFCGGFPSGNDRRQAVVDSQCLDIVR